MRVFSQRVFGFALLPLVAASSLAEPSTEFISTEIIVERMSQARQEHHSRLRPYSVIRAYKLFGKEGLPPKSEITTGINYIPPSGQSYTVLRIEGSHLGETIVRKILESEKTLLAKRSASAISTANYSFQLIREETLDGVRCYVLELRPHRNEANLLRGRVWVDSGRYLIRRVEGEPAKSPSWWVRDIHIALVFDEVEGMWLQTGFRSSAKVRLLGSHTVVSRDLEYKVDRLNAALSAQSR